MPLTEKPLSVTVVSSATLPPCPGLPLVSSTWFLGLLLRAAENVVALLIALAIRVAMVLASGVLPSEIRTRLASVSVVEVLNSNTTMGCSPSDTVRVSPFLILSNPVVVMTPLARAGVCALVQAGLHVPHASLFPSSHASLPSLVPSPQLG